MKKEIVNEFINYFNFYSILIFDKDKHTKDGLENIINSDKCINLIYFNIDESINIQINNNLCDISFFNKLPILELEQNYILSEIYRDLYMITNNLEYVNFGKKFILEILNIGK